MKIRFWSFVNFVISLALNSKFESRNSKQTKKIRNENRLENSDFEFVSCFGFRISDLAHCLRTTPKFITTLAFFWAMTSASFLPAFAAFGAGEGLDEEAKKWEVSLFESGIKYKEPGLMQEKGSLMGFDLCYTNSFSDRYDARLEVRSGWGKVDYDGHVQDLTTGTTYPATTEDVDDNLIEIRGIWEYGSAGKEGGFWQPYFGLGYRYLNDDSSNMPTTVIINDQTVSIDDLGYQREANYVYLPLGVNCGLNIESNWLIGLKAEYDLFLGGLQRSHMSDVDPGWNDTHNKQNSGYGLRGSVRIAKLDEMQDWFAEPYLIYWNIKKSNNTDDTYYGSHTGWISWEPKNNSTEWGVKLGVKF